MPIAQSIALPGACQNNRDPIYVKGLRPAEGRGFSLCVIVKNPGLEAIVSELVI